MHVMLSALFPQNNIFLKCFIFLIPMANCTLQHRPPTLPPAFVPLLRLTFATESS